MSRAENKVDNGGPLPANTEVRNYLMRHRFKNEVKGILSSRAMNILMAMSIYTKQDALEAIAAGALVPARVPGMGAGVTKEIYDWVGIELAAKAGTDWKTAHRLETPHESRLFVLDSEEMYACYLAFQYLARKGSVASILQDLHNQDVRTEAKKPPASTRVLRLRKRLETALFPYTDA